MADPRTVTLDLTRDGTPQGAVTGNLSTPRPGLGRDPWAQPSGTMRLVTGHTVQERDTLTGPGERYTATRVARTGRRFLADLSREL